MATAEQTTGPDIVSIGAAVRLVPVWRFARDLKASVSWAAGLLDSLGVPIAHLHPDKTHGGHFNMVTLETALYLLLRPGGYGFRVGTAVVPTIIDAVRGINNTKGTPHYAEMQAVADYNLHWHKQTLRYRCRRIGEAIRRAANPQKKVRRTRAAAVSRPGARPGRQRAGPYARRTR